MAVFSRKWIPSKGIPLFILSLCVSVYWFVCLDIAFLSLDCYFKHTHTHTEFGWLKNNRHLFLTVLEAGSP